MKGLFTLFLCLAICSVYGQGASERAVELEKLRLKRREESVMNRQKLEEYARQNNVPLRYLDSTGNPVILIGFDELGMPQFKAVDNSGAANTVGIPAVRAGGSLGLNLEGDGITVGVWDGGAVTDHVEFAGGKLLSSEGSTLSDHATHVTGTIMATGVNPSAKGMAPKAKVVAWDFNNDDDEMLSMVAPDESSLLLSNHSYGLITGWRFDNGWTWFGNSAISTSEDYRFGYYSNNARLWDEISFNAPYYSILKSAGNDRSDSGNGINPPDCNMGDGYDCIGDVSTAKNIITVGAVNKVSNYTAPSSVVMSSFSSWGPTDDGRIKPDFVAAGVNLFSTFSASPTAYGTLSGTSMATPSATGSMALLQELHVKLHSMPMKASTLKALAIHTVKEAGADPGPDYRFGWGLLDIEAAARVLMDEDNQNVYIEELTLNEGQTFELSLVPVPNTKIKATIVWTDPAGSPVPAALDPTNIMLVNDLDLRVVDDGSGMAFPWILNPSNVTEAASKGDNIRDNVEKLEFDTPADRPYKLVVSHKGQLTNGKQDFSLILSYTSSNQASIAYYWIGGSGSWNDPAHWSLTSNGPTASTVPTINDRVIFDENSFSGSSEVSFADNAYASSLIWFATEDVVFSLNNHSLEVAGNFTTTSGGLTSEGPGFFSFKGTNNVNNILSFDGNAFPGLTFEFNGDSQWQIRGVTEIGALILTEGGVDISGQEIKIERLINIASNENQLNISNAKITGVQFSAINGGSLALTSNNSEITTDQSSEVELIWSSIEYEGVLHLLGSVEWAGVSTVNSVVVNGDAKISGSNIIHALTIESGSTIDLANGSNQTLSEQTIINSSASEPVAIFSVGEAVLTFDGHFKLCFDNLIVEGVNLAGDAIVSAGTSSDIQNANNWIEKSCEDILFANFTYSSPCVGSLVQFESTSSGDISEWDWSFGDPATAQDISSDENPTYFYDELGTYTVSLTISNASENETISKQVVIQANDMLENRIVLSNNKLYSFRTASSYQWYKDGEPIVGATSREYDFGAAEGIFIVVTRNSGCNRASDPYTNIITSVEDFQSIKDRVSVYPNPTEGTVTLDVPIAGPYKVHLYDPFGRMIDQRSCYEAQSVLSLEALKDGVYFVRIVTDQFSITKKVVVQRH